MSTPALHITKRADYTEPSYRINTVSLNFQIRDNETTVEATLGLTLRGGSPTTPPALKLHRGKDVSVVSVQLDGAPAPYTTPEGYLEVAVTPAQAASGFTLQTTSTIIPEKNTELEGLYRSSEGMYCTQCEAEGFRAITPFIDRPDNLSIFTVRVEADKASCPVLLSNGNCTARGEVAGGARHWTVWEDPFPKPSYLFALVAGDLVARENVFTTMNGKAVACKLWTRAVDFPKSEWALTSVHKSMKWDEDRFGFEYDLQEFNVVATSDFNMGAMENKSLNIFNSRLVMATPQTASDLDYARIEGVIGHEYFHNVTGNRVTCRDWFQLTLKEGLTVYRDQEFSMDMNSRPVKRIEDVSILRRAQFSEDSGPMAHPIRPDEYQAINNFYSATVYEKGSEVIRMYATLLGTAGFRKGMDLYVKRHDGSAVTCDDFYQAMVDANPGHPALGDMPALFKWYSQAGTPALTVTPTYDAGAKTLSLHCTQSTPSTPRQPSDTKVPVLIPIAVGLLGASGDDLPLALAPGTPAEVLTSTNAATGRVEHTAVLRLTTASATFVFTGVGEKPTPSILRGFSSPVNAAVVGQSTEDLIFLLAKDTDSFNRFEAGQRLGRTAVLSLYATAAAAKGAHPELSGSNYEAIEAATAKVLGGAGGFPASIVAAFTAVLNDATLDGSFVARAITLPSESELLEAVEGGACDPVLLSAVRAYCDKALAQGMRAALTAAIGRVESHGDFAPGAPFSPHFSSAARRALRNKAYYFLSLLGQDAGGEGILEAAAHRATTATNMTDEISALGCLMGCPPTHPLRAAGVEAFAGKWGKDPLVMLKWLSLQAGGADGTAVTRGLAASPTFPITNPNANYSLFGVYAGNAPAFHAADGSGYAFLADSILKLDAINAQVAARLVAPFNKLRKVDPVRQGLMRAQLVRMQDTGKLSENVGEIVARALN